MLLKFGLALLFFLPVIESFNRPFAYSLLLIGSLLISVNLFWEKRISLDYIDNLFLILLALFSLSTIFSWSIIRSFTELLRYFAYFLVYLAVKYEFKKRELFIKFYLSAIIINTFFLSIIAAIYLLPWFNIPPPTNSMNLFYATFGHNHLSDILIYAIPITFVFFIFNKKFKPLFLLFQIFFIVMLVLSFGRTSMVSLAYAFLVYLVFIIRDEKRNRQFKGNLMLISKWIFVVTLITVTYFIIVFVLSDVFSVNLEGGAKYPKLYKPIKTELRFGYYRQAVMALLKYPITGTGLDTYGFHSKINRGPGEVWSWYTLNHYLQIFAENGFLAGGVFLSLLLISTLQMTKNLKKNQDRRLLTDMIYVATIASVLNALLDYNWQYLSIFLYYWIGASILIATNQKVTSFAKHKTGNYLRYFFIFIVILFSTKIFVIGDIDRLLSRAWKLQNDGYISEAFFLLQRAEKVDGYNSHIKASLAQIYQLRQNYELAHQYNRQAIMLNPFDIYPQIKNDFLLYTDHIYQLLSQNKIATANLLLQEAQYYYPVFFIQERDTFYTADKLEKHLSDLKIEAEKREISEEDIIIVTGRIKNEYKLLD